MSNTETFSILVSPQGKISLIYRDELGELLTQGNSQTRRASFVEPSSDNTWEADLGLSNGPTLTGFNTRQEALNAEKQWLENRLKS